MHLFTFLISRKRKSNRNRLRSYWRNWYRNQLLELAPSQSSSPAEEKEPQHKSQWPPMEESPQFKYGENQGFMRELEKHEHNDDSEFPNNHETFHRQVRASRSYDVRPPFYPVKCEKMGERQNAQLRFVMAQMNAEVYSERYELDKVVKIVEAMPTRQTLLTFCVKEVTRHPNVVRTVRATVYNASRFNFHLENWSFKPEEEEEEEEEEPQHKSQWPPMWKSVEEFKCGENHISSPSESSSPSDSSSLELEEENEPQHKSEWPPRKRRSRWGYDVEGVCHPFYPVALSRYTKCEKMGEILNAQLRFVIARMNSEAEMHGERYELDKVVKIVEAMPRRTTLLTFCVKEVARHPNVVRTVRAMVYNASRFDLYLEEWYFKPEEEATTQ